MVHLIYYTKRFLKYLFFLIPVIGIPFLYIPFYDLGFIEFANPLYPSFQWWVILVAYFILNSVTGVLLFIGLSLYFTYERAKRDKILPKMTRVFIYMVVDYLYAEKYLDDDAREAFFQKIKKFTKHKLHVEALFLAMTKIQENVAVNHSRDFKSIINNAGLNKSIRNFLFSYNLTERILAMRIISYLRIKNQFYERQIFKYSDDKNFAQRSEAYTAIIRLMEGENQFAEFIGSKYNLSIFDINVIVNAVIKNQKMNVDYIDFLSSDLNRKVIVGLILAKFRYRKGSKSLILILNHLGNEDTFLNRLAWDSFLTLVPKEDATDIIIDRFKKEPEEIQLIILKNSYGFNSDRLYDFLVEITKTESLLVKIAALKIIFAEKFEKIAQFMDNADAEVQIALQEIIDINVGN